MRRCLSISSFVVILLAVGVAFAQDEGDGGPERVADFYQGPIIASGRVVGMGGAYIGVAEGATGHLVNPVAFSYRAAPFAHDWFDWDVTLSWLTVDREADIDLDQNGTESFENARYVQGGFNLKFGAHGVGVQLRNQEFDMVLYPIEGGRSAITYVQTYAGVGYGLQWNDDLWLGAMLYGGTAALRLGGQDAAAVTGGGVLLGALYAPVGERWRIGGTARGPVVGRDVQTEAPDGALPPTVRLPDAVAVPWQVGAGASYVFGPRGGNVKATFGEGDRPADPPRRYLMVAADLVITGPAPTAAVGPESLFSGDERRSGETASASLRVGAESEVWDDLLIARAGTYYEPSRYAEGEGRIHLTGGFDVHLGELVWDWSAGAVIDWAPAYINWGVGLGFWH